MGGAWFQDVFSQSPTESEIQQVALDAIRESLGITQNPTMCHVTVCKVRKCPPTLRSHAWPLYLRERHSQKKD